MSYYDTLGDFSGVPPRRHSSASELLSAYGGYVSDPEVLEEVDPADQSASMQRANVVTAAADEDHGYGDSFEQPTADMYTVMAPLADQRPPAIVSNMSYNSGMTTWGGEPVFSSPESAALSPQAASAVSRDFTFQNFKRYDDEQKIEAVKSTPPPDHVSNVGIVRQSSVRSNSSSEGSPPPSPVYQPRMRVASTTKSRPQPIDDASSDRVGGYMPQFSTEKKPRSLSIINRALIPTIPVSPDPSEEPAPALDTPQQETRPNVEAYSVEVAEKASINLVAASTERVFRAEGDTEDDQYDLDFSTELDPVPQSHHPEDYEELPHNSPAPIEAIPTEAEEPVASEFVGEMELDSKRPLEEEELAEADEEIVSMRNQAPASSLGSSSCANEPSGHEYDEEWEDEEGEDDVIEEGRGGAAPASSVAMVTANVVALETAKPRSADLSSTEFKFSKRFLEKKGIKRKVLSQKKPVSSQKPRRMSEDNRGSDRAAVQSAPRRPAVPRFQHRSREGKASALKEGGLALELKLEAHKEDIDEAMRKKLLSDIDQAKKAYIKHCEESGVVMDGDILLNLEALAKSKTHDSRVHVSVSGHRVEVQDADQPLWRKQHPRIVQGTAGDSVHEPSRSLAIASLHSPMKTPLSDADFSVFKSQNDADAFQESPSMKATYNGFGPPIGMYHEMDSERTGVEIPLKKGGWPSPRFSSKGTPKPGMMKGSRFIVAPSTFIKPPRQKQVLDFYAAPVRFPVFRAAPVAMPTAVSSHVPAPLAAPAILTVETEDHNVIFSPRRPEGHAVGGDYSPGSPTSPIKARIAAAVASATAAAQNANSGGVPLDVEALMRSLAALGKELPLHGAVASQPKNQSRSDQHEARMRQLLHVLDPHLEHAYEAILGSRASEHSLKEAPKRVLSKKEKKELEVQDRLEKIAQQFLTDKEYDERRKKKAEQKEKREIFFENLEAKKKIERENKKKERAREKHLKAARKLIQDAVHSMGAKELNEEVPEDADRSSRAISSVKHHPLKELETAAPQLIEPELTNHLLVAAKIAAHAVDQQAHDPFLTAQKGRLDEEMLQQKLIRQQLLYEERMREQEKLLQLQILERERLEQRLIEQHQQHRPVESAESGPDTRASSTAGQPTVITMTKLSPPQFRNFLRREEENEVEEETVPESPEYSEQTAPAAGVLSFVRMEGVQAQQGPRSSGDVRQRQVGKEKLVRNRVGNEKFMENVGQSEIILKTQTGKHGRVVKELPKANGPAQRNALVSSQPEHWVLSALKDYKQEPTNIVAPQDEEAKLYDLKTGRLVQPLAHLGTAGVASQNPDTPVFSVHHKVAPSATEKQHSEVDQGPKMYSRYLTAVPPSQPQPSNRSTGSAGRRVVTIDAPSRGSSAINMSDFYEQIAMTASQQLPMDERRKLSNRGSPQAAPETSAERRRRRQEEEEEYNRYYADIFEEFKQSLPSL